MRVPRVVLAVAAVAAAVAALWLLLGERGEPETGPDLVVTEAGEAVAEPPGARDDDVHRAVFREKMAWARAEGLDTLPLGEIMARLGTTFVGTTYTPGTLDPPGPERLVVNLTELDCVTFVENILAMGRLLREGIDDWEAYLTELRRIRYRDGEMAGYLSRLHYFSEWIRNNEEKGLVRDITRELRGDPDPEPVTFMSSNRESYWQLEDPEVLSGVREIEETLSRVERHRIPQERIARVADEIQNGDVIAATSTLAGLDIAHTGIALWQNGRLHLLHAPLVGKSVEISELPLADRIVRIDTQDGVMVARPL